MQKSLSQYAVVGTFSCLGADCPDTCCRGWDMPADAAQRAHYAAKAPELLATIDVENGIMKRAGSSQHCAQLCEGTCRVHTRYGEDFLGDACYFYPRAVHQLGMQQRMTGAMSCPEMLRLILTETHPFELKPVTVPRVPTHRRDLVPNGWSTDEVHALMDHCMALAGDETRTPEEALDMLLQQSYALANAAGDDWPQQLNAPRVSPMPQPRASDSHAIYYALTLTEAFGEPNISLRLGDIMTVMAQRLDCNVDRTTRALTLGPQASSAVAQLQARWRSGAADALAPTLRRWLQAQLALTAFPFGGLPSLTMPQRAAVLVQRFATIRIALICHVMDDGTPPDEATVLRVIQGIARFMDHLADAKLTLMIHRDSGWESEARLRGLVAG